MDADSELKLREKTAKADAKKGTELALKKASSATTEVPAVDADVVGGDGAPPAVIRPGAVAVRGPEYQGSGFGDASIVLGGGTRGHAGEGGGDDLEEAPLKVDSYVVPDRRLPTDEEIRQRILSNTEHAEAVGKVEPAENSRGVSRNAKIWLLVAAVVVAVAIAIGVAVPMSNQPTTISSSQQPDENVVASIKFWQGLWVVSAQTREISGSQVTSGSYETVFCKPTVCTYSDTSCVVAEYYVPGCCAGADCPNETKCGETCPLEMECDYKDPKNKTCLRSECLTCPKENGEDIYTLFDFAFTIDCLEVGTAIRPDNGMEYKWAIFCGPVSFGPIVEQNRDWGEYQCSAARLGARYEEDFAPLTGTGPCQYYALAECGCGPSDMYTFGLPAPTGPCQPDSGCPFLCEGVGGSNDYARNLCRSFPGNISWWEGSFASYENRSVPVSALNYTLDIYIKGVD